MQTQDSVGSLGGDRQMKKKLLGNLKIKLPQLPGPKTHRSQKSEADIV